MDKGSDIILMTQRRIAVERNFLLLRRVSPLFTRNDVHACIARGVCSLMSTATVGRVDCNEAVELIPKE